MPRIALPPNNPCRRPQRRSLGTPAPGRRGPILIPTSAAVSEELSEGFRTLAPGLSRRESTTWLLGCLSARNNYLRQIAYQASRGGERTEVDVTDYVRVRISIVKPATDSERVCIEEHTSDTVLQTVKGVC